DRPLAGGPGLRRAYIGKEHGLVHEALARGHGPDGAAGTHGEPGHRPGAARDEDLEDVDDGNAARAVLDRARACHDGRPLWLLPPHDLLRTQVEHPGLPTGDRATELLRATG